MKTYVLIAQGGITVTVGYERAEAERQQSRSAPAPQNVETIARIN
jgi:hypothetical protein